MGATVRARIRDTLAGGAVRAPAPLLRAIWRLYEWGTAARERLTGPRLGAGGDGLPVPPAKLRVLVVGRGEAEFFLRSGQAHNAFIRELLSHNDAPVEGMGSILDLGCGCGRVARWWADLDRPTVSGCDYNGELVEWCARNLPFVRARENGLEPPLPFAAGSFDFLYALSVFTHLTQSQEQRWIAELERVLRPGALALITVNGRAYADRLSAAERGRFDRGAVVTRFADVSGTNMCATYHPPSYVEAEMLAGRFRIVDSVRPDRDRGRAAESLGQDAYLIRRSR